MVEPVNEQPIWLPPVLRTVATEGSGMEQVWQAIIQHRQHLEASGEWQQRERSRLETELDALLQATLVSRWRNQISAQEYQRVIARLVDRRISPWQAVQALLDGGQT